MSSDEPDLSGARTKKLLDLVRQGVVKEHCGGGRIRVVFGDRNGMTSQPLQVLYDRPGDHYLPALGDPVVCLMLPPDQVDGWVLGRPYDARTSPPSDDPDVRVLAGTDIRLGDVDAPHPAPFGDVALKLLQGLFDLLKTAQVMTAWGPAPLASDVAGQNAYGAGGITVVTTAMANAADGLAGLNSEKVKLPENDGGL